jgi:asparagine synthase (glutamine-hydrolysing)
MLCRPMCGICGILAPGATVSPDERAVAVMAAAMAHRGPDHQGMVRDGPVVLGHRRLSIIDLSAAGNQPMANEDRTVWAVANGEIYNFAELRRDLETRGHRFRSHSDSEILVHLYEERGEDMVQALRGMYAFALWDGKRQRLLLVRDRLGKKPIYFAQLPSGFAFASEAAALVTAMPGRPGPDLAAIDQYLTLQYVPAPATAFEGVGKLPAGHLLTVEPGGKPQLRRYWRLSFAPRRYAPQSENEAVEELRPLLEEAVRLREISDVPLGAFLSGGLDSSLVVALMARQRSRPVKTFSIDFPGGAGEGRWARLVARRWHTDHREMVVDPDMVGILPELVRRYGEPFADTSAVPVYYLSKMAREDVTVALSGDGGDEVFGGYRRYLWDKLARDLLAAGPAGTAGRLLMERLPGARGEALRRFAATLSPDLDMAARYLPLVAHFSPRDKQGLTSAGFRAAAGRGAGDQVEARFRAILRDGTARDDINRLLELDTQTYLPDDILVKVDIASMAHALEVRAPLLDHVLVEWMAGLPGELKLRGLRGKRLLRKVARDLVPAAILTRKKKGFAMPVDGWFRGPLRAMARDLLATASARTAGWLQATAVTRLLDEHDAGFNHGERLWNLLVLELWLRH